MTKLRIILCSSLFLVPFFSSATTYTQEGQITGMFTGNGNVIGIFHSASWYNPANCASGQNDKAYLIDYGDQGDWDKVYSMLLASYMSEKLIKIGVRTDKCYSGYPVIDRVAFKKGY